MRVVQHIIGKIVIAPKTEIRLIVLTIIDVRRVAVDQVLMKVPVVAVEAYGQGVVSLPCSAKLREFHFIAHRLRIGEHRAWIRRQHFDRRRSYGTDPVRSARRRQMKRQWAVFIGQIAIALAQCRLGAIAKAVIRQTADADVERKFSKPCAVFGIAREVGERSAGQFACAPSKVSPLFILSVTAPPSGIQAKDRIVGLQRKGIDSKFRNQIPINVVAKGFIQTDAILINRQSFCDAEIGDASKPR